MFQLLEPVSNYNYKWWWRRRRWVHLSVMKVMKQLIVGITNVVHQKLRFHLNHTKVLWYFVMTFKGLEHYWRKATQPRLTLSLSLSPSLSLSRSPCAYVHTQPLHTHTHTPHTMHMHIVSLTTSYCVCVCTLCVWFCIPGMSYYCPTIVWAIQEWAHSSEIPCLSEMPGYILENSVS